MAIWLNDLENHRSETQYEDWLVAKVFTFQLLNCYAYLGYLSFVKPFLLTKCVDDDCYQEISDTLLVLFVAPVLIGALREVFLRKYLQMRRFAAETTDLEPGREVGVVEEQYILQEYRALDATLRDYSELVLQYGYVAMYVAVFPIGPFIALMAAFVKIRIDGWKLCQVYRRPQPKTAEDIGVWQNVLDIVGVLAVINNFALVFFTGRYLEDVTWDLRWVSFLAVEHAAVVYKVFLSVTIEEVSEAVQMQLDRQRFLVRKVLGNAMDEADEEDVEARGEMEDFDVAPTDLDWVYPVVEEVAADSGGEPMKQIDEDDKRMADSQL